MWCKGQSLHYGIDCLPSRPSCTGLDRSLRLYHIRTAASAPLQSTQFAQSESTYENDTIRRRTQFMHARPLSSCEDLVSDEPTFDGPAPGIGAQNPLAQPSRQVRSVEGAATLPFPNANVQALPADQPRTGVQFEGSNWTAAGSNVDTDREGSVREATEFRESILEAGIVSAAPGSSSSSSSSVSNNSAGIRHETEILIRTIAGYDLRQQTTASNVSLASGPDSAQHWDTASLLCALDRLPETPEKVIGRMGSAPAGLRREALLGPGGGALVSPVSPQPVGSVNPPANPSFQNLHISEAIRGLFSVIAPASSLLARSESFLGEDLLQSSLTAPIPTPLARTGSTLQAASVPQTPLAGGPAAMLSEVTTARAAGPGSPVTTCTTGTGPVAGNLHEAACLSEGSFGQQHQQQHQAGQRTQFPGQDPAAVPLLYAAAGVVLPQWAAQSLPPPAPGPNQDPAVEWALGVLSNRVTPREPRQVDLHLANRILAVHLGSPSPNLHRASTAAAASTEDSGVAVTWVNRSGHGRRVVQRATAALPWPLLLPVLDAVSSRLSPSSALALLRSISDQVGPHWRQDLAPREQARLAATLRVCFRVALRNPDAVSASAAAGLMEVMCRLHVRSEPACALLVGRILASVVPTWRATALPLLPSHSPENVEPVPHSPGEPADQMPLAKPAAPEDDGPASAGMSEFHERGHSERIGAQGRSVGDGRNAFRWQRWSSASSISQLPLGKPGKEAGGGGARTQLLLGPRWRRVQLRWTCVAMSTLARLRISRLSLPQRALTKLLWAALYASAHWTPGIAAAIPVWAARLDSPPPAAFLRRYSNALLGTSTSAPAQTALSKRRERLWRRQKQQRQHQNQLGRKNVRKGVFVRRDGDDAAAVSTMLHGRRCLVDRMTAPQLAAAMEALVAHYGPCTARPKAVAAAVADAVSAGRSYKGVGHIFASCIGSNYRGWKSSGTSSSGGNAKQFDYNKHEASSSSQCGNSRRMAMRYGDYRTLMHALATALFTRLRQLRCQQLCRLPLLLCRVGQPEEAAGREGQWQQDFVRQVRQLLPSCDVVDVMLLLRGLAALRASAAAQAGVDCADPRTESLSSTVACRHELIGSELPDAALRHYTTLLPSATLYHTAAVLESLSMLWGRSANPHWEKRGWSSGQSSSGTDNALQPPQAVQLQPERNVPNSMAANARATVETVSRGAARLALEAAGTACMEEVTRTSAALSPGLPSTSPEAELRQRRLADLASERDFLMQQLDEHVATCLSYSVSRLHGVSTRWRGSQRNRQAEAGLRISVGLVVKVLAAYSHLQRPPHPRLQSALEAALVEGADFLGTSGWQRVRAVYQQLQLQPGPELSVALLTFA